MSYINYCINLTEEEKFEIDNPVRKNRLELRLAIFFPFLPFPIVPQVLLFPVEGFSPQQIVRNVRDGAESAILQKLNQAIEDGEEIVSVFTHESGRN